MIRYTMILFLVGAGLSSRAQSMYTISGSVRDSLTGEAVIGATVLATPSNAGTVTNAYGFYSMTLTPSEYVLTVRYLGYTATLRPVQLRKNLKMDFRIMESAELLDEIVVTSDREDDLLNRTEMGTEKLDVKKAEKIPVMMGEKDILKTLQLLPGIKSAGEGSVGLFVRGGGADQNLILLDEAPIYNASHFLSFFSVFNSDALKDVTLYKGSMSAEYGGRLSSVLDIKTIDGNNQHFDLQGGIGLIASRLSIQGPLVKDKSSFILSGRRTYADVFLKLSDDAVLKDSKLYFYDLNAKVNYTLSDRSRLFLSGYSGRDRMAVSDIFGIDWGNQTATLRWNYLLSDKVFSNASLIYSNYNYEVRENNGGNNLYTTSQIKDYNFKLDVQAFINTRNTIKSGFNSIYHTIVPGVLTSSQGTKSSELSLKRYSWENAVYVAHEWSAREKLTVAYGIRLSSFSILGPGDFYHFNAEGVISDTTTHGAGEILKTYFTPEPRVSVNYKIGRQSAVKAAYVRTAQYLHLISSAAVSQPTDMWLPTSEYVKPELGDQYSVGYFADFKEHAYEFSAEVYYKQMRNQIDFKDGAQLELNNSVETELLFGRGRAYGTEFLLKKKKGRLSGWIGYTLARTERQIESINQGEYYPARQDRTHDISIVGIFDLSQKWSFSASWVYNTGNAATFPSGKYSLDGQVVNYYTERNGYRMPAYHRLDLGATWLRKKTKRFESSWTFSVYNAYARQNPFMINFRKNYEDPLRSEIVQLSLFTIIPAVSYNFKF
jgi:hypothetical protein